MLYVSDELAEFEFAMSRQRLQTPQRGRPQPRRQDRRRRKRGEQRAYNGIWRRRLHRID